MFRILTGAVRRMVPLAALALVPTVGLGQFIYNPHYRAWGTPAAVGYSAYYGQQPGQPVSAVPLPATTCTTCTQVVCQYVPHTTYRVAYRQVPVTTYQNFTTVDPCTGCPRVCMRPVTTCVRQCYYVPCTTYHRVCRQVAMPTTCQTVAQPVAVAPAPACAPCGGAAVVAPAAPAIIAPPTSPGLPAPSLLAPPPAGTPTVVPPASSPTSGFPQPPNQPFAAPTTAPWSGQPKESSVARPPSQLKPLAPAADGNKQQLQPPPLLDPRQRTADLSPAQRWNYTATSATNLDDAGWVAK